MTTLTTTNTPAASCLPGLASASCESRFLYEIQLLGEELKALVATADDLIAGTYFKQYEVLEPRQRASLLIDTAKRLILGAISETNQELSRGVHGKAQEQKLVEFQSVGEELRAVLDTVDDLLTEGGNIPERVPNVADRASWLLGTALRLSLWIHGAAYSGLPSALMQVQPAATGNEAGGVHG